MFLSPWFQLVNAMIFVLQESDHLFLVKIKYISVQSESQTRVFHLYFSSKPLDAFECSGNIFAAVPLIPYTCHDVQELGWLGQVCPNKRVSQMWAPLAAHRQPVGDQNRPPNVLYVYKTWYILIHASHTCTVAFWLINNIPPRISWNQICYKTNVLYSSNICEILLCNWQLVVLTYEMIYVVQAAHHSGKIIVKHCDYSGTL